MIKVTFQGQGGIYWAVCQSVSRIQGDGFGYLLESVREDSCGMGPHPWAKVPGGWAIILVEEI